MEIDEIEINTFNGHRMMLKNKLRSGNCVYQDIDGGGYVICSPAMLKAYELRRAPFAPVIVKGDLIPTESKAIHWQMCGRIKRLSQQKIPVDAGADLA